MYVSSDTIRSTSVILSSTLRHEELDDLLVMDWWFDAMAPNRDTQKAGVRRAEVEGWITDQLKPINEKLTEITKTQANISEQLQNSGVATGWTKARQRIVSFGSPAAIVALCIALLAIAFGALYQSFGHVKDETAFRTHTEDQLASINTSLLELHAAIFPSKALNEIRHLDENAFAKALPALYAVTKQPIEGVRPDEPTLRAISQKLQATDENAPDYWSTVLQFIRFASSHSVKNVPPHGNPTLIIARNRGFNPMDPIRDSVVLLDGGDLGPVRFERCRIIFTEHPVHMNDVRFVNCVFELPETNSPNPYLKKAAVQLLASNFTNIKSL